MASIIRSSVSRQACVAPTAKHIFPAKTSYSAFSTLSTSTAAPSLVRLPRLSTRDAFRGPMRVAPFHTTAKRDILPALPQHVDGTANDAAPVPAPHPTHGSYHWTFERLVAAALIPVTIAPFAGGSLNPVLDATFCALLIVHSHIGFQSVIIDYLPTWRVPKSRKTAEWALRIATLAVAVGLYEFETNDVGITEATKRIWKA